MPQDEKLSLREKIVLNKFQFSKAVIKQAEDENTQVGIHAMNIFNTILEMRFKYAIKMAEIWPHKIHHSDSEPDFFPWQAGFEAFIKREGDDNNKDLNHTISMCFELAENLRTGCDIDMQARLEQGQDKLEKTAPSIIKPSADMLKDVTLREEIPGLHSQ